MNKDNTLHNAFSNDPANDQTDNELISQALTGDKTSLETLLNRHQPWIYNLAFRMVMVHQDAQDVTQEVLIKIMTKLSTFDPSRASFRTWLYRVVVNHILNMKTRGYEAAINDIEDYYSFVDKVPDQDLENSPENKMVVEDIGIGCVMGVMLCLERKLRVAFLLAIGFNVSDAQGSEIMEVSRDGFRKLLSRARQKLHNYMNGNCSLMNPDARCHCRKKAKGFMSSGAYGPDRLTFVQKNGPKLKDIIDAKIGEFSREVYGDYIRLLREHPFYRAPEITDWLKERVARPDFNEIFDVN